MEQGKVYLAGAGPGDEKLISVRALELIKEADVIIYDHLASKKLLKQAKNDCEFVYVGKMPNQHTLNQIEINQVLVQKAKQNKKVLRLKGGDPFIFGRGGEEAEELFDKKIPFEVIPGISSFYAACSYEGIPITHRNYVSSFHVFTGHFKAEEKLDFKLIAKLEGTLIFLMGMKNIKKICSELLKYGKDPHTPSAVIQWGTTSKQKLVEGEIVNISEIAEKENLKHPAVIVMGDVVKAKEKIQWQKYRPLWGKKFLIMKTEQAESEMSQKLYELGAEVTEFPLIQIGEPTNWKEIDDALEQIEKFTWIFFTSQNGVNYFFDRMKQKKKDIRCLWKANIFCIGERTKKAIEEKGLFVNEIPNEYNSDSAVLKIKQFLSKEDNVLLPVSEIADVKIQHAIEEIGATYDRVTAYSNKKNVDYDTIIIEKIKNNYYSALIFTSSSQVKNYYEIMRTETGKAKVLSIGSATTKTAEQLGIKVDFTASISTIDNLIKEIKNMLYHI